MSEAIRCPDCHGPIEYRTEQRSPLENVWVHYCPRCDIRSTGEGDDE